MLSTWKIQAIQQPVPNWQMSLIALNLRPCTKRLQTDRETDTSVGKKRFYKWKSQVKYDLSLHYVGVGKREES